MSADTEIQKRKFELIPRFIRVYMSIPSIFIDGAIVMLIAMLTTLATAFSGEEAYKYVSPALLFWAKVMTGVVANGLVALQSFRSKIFADYQASGKNKQTDTTQT